MLILTSFSHACEPASLNWQQFKSSHDRNHNGTFELEEFMHVRDFEPYPWPADPRFQDKDKQQKLFNFLDKNKDGHLTDEELGAVHQLFENPCADWPWSKAR
ncbi:EF-hand domain-containing protein [Acinetobacter ihumii]|uniref:EF-hand domain-containing protein n=1 Tax=Acinetobacter ihumii TaxID=2483802 RepID=UPI001D185427|nr:EF-hand domain-containing protein [Acinetobacter ihumii]